MAFLDNSKGFALSCVSELGNLFDTLEIVLEAFSV
jgi:hypothetical protein